MNDMNYCVMCSEISFDESLKDKIPENKIIGFTDWLKENKMPTKEITYYDFLGKTQETLTHPFLFVYKKGETFSLNSEDEFLTNDKYGIVFLMVTPAWAETYGETLGISYATQKAFLSVTKLSGVAGTPQATENFFCEKLY